MKLHSVKLFVILCGYVFSHSRSDEPAADQEETLAQAAADQKSSLGDPTRVVDQRSTIKPADPTAADDDGLAKEAPPRQPVPSGSFTTARQVKKTLADQLANTSCPLPTSACPILSSTLSKKLLANTHSHDNLSIALPWECVNLQEELTACGACHNNCMKIKYAKDVGCEKGRCKIFTCRAGYTLQVTRSSKAGHKGRPLVQQCVLLKKGRA